MNFTGGPNVVTCEQCMPSSCLTPQYNVCSFMIPVTTHWYDNYGLAVLQQLQDLTWARQFVGLLILGISALIATITSVTVAAISLTQQMHTAQYVGTMSKNVSLTLAIQEAIDRNLEMRVDALEEAIMHIGTELQALKVKMALMPRWLLVDMRDIFESKQDRLWVGKN